MRGINFRVALRKARNTGIALQRGFGSFGTALSKSANLANAGLSAAAAADPLLFGGPIGKGVRGVVQLAGAAGESATAIGRARNLEDVGRAADSFGQAVVSNAPAIAGGLATAAMI